MTSPVQVGFHVADYILFIIFLLISVGIGLYHALTGDRQRTIKEYTVANRQMKTLPVAISMFVSIVSGVLVLGHPVEVYTRGGQFAMRAVGHVLAASVAGPLFVPLFFRLKITSCFEYLEQRYNSKTVKLLGTISMLVGTTIQMGIVMYAPAVALEAVIGLPLWISITITAAVAILYTTLGGIKAVIWSDVFQAGCMIVGMILILIQGIVKVGGVSRVWDISSEGGRTHFFDFSVDPTKRVTFWTAIFGSMFTSLALFGIGQMSVQRYCSLPKLQQAKSALYISAFLMVLVFALATGVGLVIYAYYQQAACDPIRAEYITSPNQLVPYFILEVLNYPGLPGAFLAVLFGGALSTVSSTLNSASAVTWQDILKHFFRHLSEFRKTLVTKTLVVLYGLMGIGVAFGTQYLGRHVIQIFLMVLGTFYGPMLGIFALGAFFPFANAKGAIVGSVIAMAFNLWIVIGNFLVSPHKIWLPTTTTGCSSPSAAILNSTCLDDITSVMTTTDLMSSTHRYGTYWLYSLSFMLYPLIGCIVTVLVGILVSLLTAVLCPDSSINITDKRHLLIPVFNVTCPCLSSSVRQRLHCGLQYESNDQLTCCVTCDDDFTCTQMKEKCVDGSQKTRSHEQTSGEAEILEIIVGNGLDNTSVRPTTKPAVTP